EFLPQQVFEVSTEKPTQALPSVVQPPKLEQKPLPEHLKYAYLGREVTAGFTPTHQSNWVDHHRHYRN
ncbi:hypothetical protein LINGRAHAP2_LOCUS7553, partial [Linum grandiflorum]